jgi:hypothetical protein
MICSACQLHITIERAAADLLLTYNIDDWSARCHCADLGSPTLCKNLRPTIPQLLATRKVAPLGTGEPGER